jgi:hypothetical protein
MHKLQQVCTGKISFLTSFELALKVLILALKDFAKAFVILIIKEI